MNNGHLRFESHRERSRVNQPKKLTFKDEGKIREVARRGEAWGTSEARQTGDNA